jgi:hypothetical protein
MKFRGLLYAMVALATVGAMGAAGASAEVVTKAGQWYTGATAGGVTTLKGSQTITTEIAEHPEIGLKAEKKATIAGKPIRTLMSGFSCVECKIENKEVTSKAGSIAYGSGKLKFTGATVVEPKGCTMSSEAGVAGEILTRKVVIHGDWMDTAAGNEHVFLQFIPEAGATAAYAQIRLSAGECESIEGPYNITGTLFGEMKNNRGVMATSQQVVISPAVQATTGAALKLGGNSVTLTGTAKVSAGGNFFGIK